MNFGNHQATDTKRYKITIIVLDSTNPYLPDRVEFKHQFVNFKAGHRVSVQGVKSLGGHFACLCRGFDFYEVFLFILKLKEIFRQFDRSDN